MIGTTASRLPQVGHAGLVFYRRVSVTDQKKTSVGGLVQAIRQAPILIKCGCSALLPKCQAVKKRSKPLDRRLDLSSASFVQSRPSTCSVSVTNGASLRSTSQ